MSSQALSDYVGATPDDADFVQKCYDDASALVLSYVGSADVAEQLLNGAILETGSELFHRRNAPMGVSQYAAFDGSAIRIARDPLTPAYPILARAMVTGF